MSLAAILAAADAASTILATVNAIAPMIPALVDSVDAVMPAGTPGKDKLEAFKGVLAAAVGVEAVAANALNSAWPAVTQIVNAVVAAKKAIKAAIPSAAA